MHFTTSRLTTKRKKAKVLSYEEEMEWSNGRRESVCVQVNGRRVHIVGVVYLGYTRVILLSVFFSSVFAAGVGMRRERALEVYCDTRVMGLRPVSLFLSSFFGSLYHSFLDIFYSLFPYTPCIA